MNSSTKQTLTLLALLHSSPAAAQVSATEVSERINQAGNSIIAYLPDLQSMPIAKSLKDAAQRNLPVTLLAPKEAHMKPGSYLISVALSNAQPPPQTPQVYFRESQKPTYHRH